VFGAWCADRSGLRLLPEALHLLAALSLAFGFGWAGHTGGGQRDRAILRPAAAVLYYLRVEAGADYLCGVACVIR